MKNILTIILLLACIHAQSQTDPNCVSFENQAGSTTPYFGPSSGCNQPTPVEGAQVDNIFYECAYGVSFHEGSLGGPPVIYAQVGNPGFGFQNTSGSTYLSELECNVISTHINDKPTDDTPGSVNFPGFIWNDLGCFFMTTNNKDANIYIRFTEETECFSVDGTWSLIIQSNSNFPVQNNGIDEYNGEVHLIQKINDEQSWSKVPSTKGTVSSELKFSIYPNPGNGLVTISTTSSFDNSRIEITDSEGRVIHTVNMSENNNKIDVDLSMLARGIYMVKLIQNDGTVSAQRYVKK